MAGLLVSSHLYSAALPGVGNAEACSDNAGMLARDGRCKTLDASGDGYVRAETCVTLLLEALAGGQQAAAILKGSAVNQVKVTTARWNRPLGQLCRSCLANKFSERNDLVVILSRCLPPEG